LLRRKIVDHYRQRGRHRQEATLDASDPVIDACFDQKGSWARWPLACELDPAVLRERADFWVAFEQCHGALPERLREAFTLRVMEEMPPDEVCKVLSITPTNLWVALHRARARLRACLEANWFRTEEADKR
jgi:RNA polymerase sigma-70 factor (ECF subfamily)